MFPLRARSWTRRHGMVFCVISVVLANVYPVMAAYRPTQFDWRCYRCAYQTVDPKSVWTWLGPLCISLFLLLPNVVVIVTTGILLYYVKKVSGENKQAILTLVPVSIVYIVSYAPIGVYFVAETGLANPRLRNISRCGFNEFQASFRSTGQKAVGKLTPTQLATVGHRQPAGLENGQLVPLKMNKFNVNIIIGSMVHYNYVNEPYPVSHSPFQIIAFRCFPTIWKDLGMRCNPLVCAAAAPRNEGIEANAARAFELSSKQSKITLRPFDLIFSPVFKSDNFLPCCF
eukprot:sb/3467743/